MLVKIFSLVFNSAARGFDDTELRDFLKDKEVISIHDHLFVRNEVPYLTLIVKYFPLRQEIDPKMVPQGKRDESWKEQISEADMGIFNLLRDWRSTQCKQEGVPPYVLFTNKQLAQMIKIKPVSLSDLSNVEGVGKAKVEKYGSSILAIFTGAVALPPKVEPKSENEAVVTETTQ